MTTLIAIPARYHYYHHTAAGNHWWVIVLVALGLCLTVSVSLISSIRRRADRRRGWSTDRDIPAGADDADEEW